MKKEDIEFGIVKFAREHPVDGFTMLLGEATFFRCDRCNAVLILSDIPDDDHDPRPHHAQWHALSVAGLA
jgi:hypothetical protein